MMRKNVDKKYLEIHFMIVWLCIRGVYRFNMTYMKIFIIILVVIAQSSAKMFLFGSILQYDNNKAYQKLI